MASTASFSASTLFSLENHICLITGGGSGIGLMAAQALAANGAKVYITGRRVEALDAAAKAHCPSQQKQPGDSTGQGRIIPLGPCDVTKKSDLEKLVQELESKEDYLNLLICNAGISGPKVEDFKDEDGNVEEEVNMSGEDLRQKLWAGESVEDWGQTFETDVTGVYFTGVAFLGLLGRAMQKDNNNNNTSEEEGGSAAAGAGRFEKFSSSIITISSMSGLMRDSQGHFSYNAAKGATVHLSKMMSAEFQKVGVRVNSIAPGYFPSEMTTQTSNSAQKSSFPQEKIEQAGHVPMMRAGRDEEIGMGVLLFAKNMYVNGEILAIDGGVLNVVGGR